MTDGKKIVSNVTHGLVEGQVNIPNYYHPLTLENDNGFVYPELENRLRVSNIPVVAEAPGSDTVTPTRMNWDAVPLPLASRSVSRTSGETSVTNNVGIIITVNVTAIDPTGNLVISLEGRDPASLSYYNVATFNAITSISLNVFTVYPGIVEVTGSRFNMVLPSYFRLVSTQNAVNITYSIGMTLII